MLHLNLVVMQELLSYLNKSYRLYSDQYFSFKSVLKIGFVGVSSPKLARHFLATSAINGIRITLWYFRNELEIKNDWN